MTPCPPIITYCSGNSPSPGLRWMAIFVDTDERGTGTLPIRFSGRDEEDVIKQASEWWEAQASGFKPKNRARQLTPALKKAHEVRKARREIEKAFEI